MITPLYHHNSPQTLKMLGLADEAVISSSLLLIMGQQGTGKTHFGRLLERKYAKSLEKDVDKGKTFKWKNSRFNCYYSRQNSKSLLIDLIESINPDAKIATDRVSRLIAQLVEVVRVSGNSLLFLDNADQLESHDRAIIQEAVKTIREDRPFGLVMTSHIDQADFLILGQHSSSLPTVVLKHVDAVENLNGLKAHDNRFAPWVERLKKGDTEALDLAKRLREATLGNFDRIAKLCLSLKANISDDTLTVEEIEKVLKKRGTPES